jgi:hypothetical protein
LALASSGPTGLDLLGVRESASAPRFDAGGVVMKHRNLLMLGGLAIGMALVVSVSLAIPGQEKYTLKVPGGLTFSEFRGYESWEAISISRTERLVAVILGNSKMIDAYKAGFPANGKVVPDGAKMAKIHWRPKAHQSFPNATVPGALVNVDFMVKDMKRFADSGGWGYAVFDYDAASNSYKPGTLAGTPPQGNDARCGFTCHKRAASTDYVFTEYGAR